jgi:class 3 adenylate cyclase
LLALDGVGGTPKLEIEICPETTVIESDLVGSTALAATLEPLDVCIMLHDLYTRWDALTTIDGIVKITTIGDAYLAVAGPHFDENNGTKETGALAAVRMACSMLEEASKVKAVKHNIKDGEQEGEAKSIAIRIGVATGRIYGAILGTRQFQWQIWGPALSDATRYEETGIPGQVHISKTTCVYAREAIQHIAKKERRDLKFILEETDEEQKEKDDEYSQGYYVEYC